MFDSAQIFYIVIAPPPTKTTAPGSSTAATSTIAANTTTTTTTTTTNDDTINASSATTINNTTVVGSKKSSYSRQPAELNNAQPIQAPALTTQPNIPAQQAPSVKTQPTVSSQQTIAAQHQQQQLQYQHSMAQQGQSFNAHPSLNQPRQPFPMYQMSQQGMRAQQYMMGQHPYMAQPAKIPFLQQHPNQQHIIMAAQNSMLQHQMQNASMSVNQHEAASHHLVTQHANAVMSEISGMYWMCGWV